MEFILLAAILLLIASLVFNFVLFKKYRTAKKDRQETYDVLELLHDLTAGRGYVEIKRISPSNYFLRSPRGGQ